MRDLLTRSLPDEVRERLNVEPSALVDAGFDADGASSLTCAGDPPRKAGGPRRSAHEGLGRHARAAWRRHAVTHGT